MTRIQFIITVALFFALPVGGMTIGYQLHRPSVIEKHEVRQIHVHDCALSDLSKQVALLPALRGQK